MMLRATAVPLLLLLLATTAATAAPVADPLTVYGGSSPFTLAATVMGLGRANGGCLAYGPNPKSGSVQPVSIRPCGPGVLLFVYDKKTQALQLRSDTSSSLSGACLADFGSSTKGQPGQPVVMMCSKTADPAQAWFMVRKPTSGGAQPAAFLRSKSGLCLVYDEAKDLVVGVKCGAKNELEFGISGL